MYADLTRKPLAKDQIEKIKNALAANRCPTTEIRIGDIVFVDNIDGEISLGIDSRSELPFDFREWLPAQVSGMQRASDGIDFEVYILDAKGGFHRYILKHTRIVQAKFTASGVPYFHDHNGKEFTQEQLVGHRDNHFANVCKRA